MRNRGRATPRVQREILEKQGYLCAYCDCDLKKAPIQYDHFVPFVAGGVTKESNLFAACEDCNKAKSDSFFESMEQARAVIQSRRRIPIIVRNLPQAEEHPGDALAPAPIRRKWGPRHIPKHMRPLAKKPHNGHYCRECHAELTVSFAYCSRACHRANKLIKTWIKST